MVTTSQEQQLHDDTVRRNSALVIDGYKTTFTQLSPLLSEMGLEPLSANDEDEAIRLFQQAAPFLVLADSECGSLDGYQLASRLRRKDPTRSTAIVIMGSGDDRKGRMAALKAGADDFITKPIDIEEAKLRLTLLLRKVRSESSTNGNRRVEAAPLPSPSTPTEGSAGLYEQLTGLVGEALHQARHNNVVELGKLQEFADELVHKTESTSELIARALETASTEDLATHHVNVAIFGLAVARELGFVEKQLRRFAQLALVHDLGMTKIPGSILAAPRRLTREEFRIVSQHPQHTFETLKAAGWAELAEIAYQEHERASGQGYPRGLPGSEIHELAALLGVADVYEACTHSRPHRRSFIPYDALQKLLEMRGVCFHPRYIKALMNAMTVFPPGSWVQLNTGEIGRVRAVNKKNLMRPLVEIIWNSRGERLKRRKALDLRESPFLFVNRPLYESDLPPT